VHHCQGAEVISQDFFTRQSHSFKHHNEISRANAQLSPDNFEEYNVPLMRNELSDYFSRLDGENVTFEASIRYRANAQEPLIGFLLFYRIHNSTEWSSKMIWEKDSGSSSYSTLYAQKRLWWQSGYDSQYKVDYSDPSDAPLSFLLETKPSTLYMTKLFSDLGEERSRQNNRYKEYRKRGENPEVGTYELIISTAGLGYFIEYVDTRGVELRMDSVKVEKQEHDDLAFQVTENHEVWWDSPTMKKRMTAFLEQMSSFHSADPDNF